jgi:hypothetical protein
MHELTLEARETAREEAMKEIKAVNGEKSNPQNLYNLLIFFNPAVGALPQHEHLFAEPGCFNADARTNRECGGANGQSEESPLPPQFQGLPALEENQKKWETHIRKFITVKGS